MQMKPQMSPPHALAHFWKCRFCPFKTKHQEIIRAHESSRHRRTEQQRRIRIPNRQDRPAHSPRLKTKRQDERRRYIRRLRTPDLTNTRRIPTRPGTLPLRRRVVISPTPDVEILERPSSLERQPPSEVPPAPPSPSLPDVPAHTGPDEDAISIAGSASSIGTQAGSSTQSESATQTSDEQEDRLNRLMDECQQVCQTSAGGSGHHRIAESQTFYQALHSGEGVGRTI